MLITIASASALQKLALTDLHGELQARYVAEVVDSQEYEGSDEATSSLKLGFGIGSSNSPPLPKYDFDRFVVTSEDQLLPSSSH